MSESGSAGRRAAAPPCTLVIFGATGDLTKRLVMPALYNLSCDGLLPRQFAIVGTAMDELTTETFRERMRAYAAQRLTPADFERELAVDSEIGFEEIDDATVADILRLAPFGFGNPAPLFVARGIEVAAPPEIRNERHVFLRLRANGRTLRLKAWDFAGRVDELPPGARIDVAFTFEDDPYSASRGYSPWQAVLKDVRVVD